MKKWRAVFSLILNLLIIGGVGFAILNLLLGYWDLGMPTVDVFVAFRYFTNISNAFLALIALIYIFCDIAALTGKRIPKFFAVLKLMATVGTTVTLIVTAAYLAPQNALGVGWGVLYDPHYFLFVHTVVPLLGILAFAIENLPKLRFRAAFLGVIPVAVYALVMGLALNLNLIPRDPVPYSFLIFDSAKWYVSVIWAAGTLVGSYLIGLLLLALRRIGYVEETVAEDADVLAEAPAPAPEAEPSLEEAPEKPEEEEPKPEEAAPVVEPEPVKEEPSPEPAPAPAPAPARRVAPKPAIAPAKKPAAGAPSAVRTYHITKQQDTGRWQVKLAKGQKAIRVFATQAEAIAFTKGLVESRGGSYRIHSLKGKIRK